MDNGNTTHYQSDVQVFIRNQFSLILTTLVIAAGIPILCSILSCLSPIIKFRRTMSKNAEEAYYIYLNEKLKRNEEFEFDNPWKSSLVESNIRDTNVKTSKPVVRTTDTSTDSNTQFEHNKHRMIRETNEHDKCDFEEVEQDDIEKTLAKNGSRISDVESNKKLELVRRRLNRNKYRLFLMKKMRYVGMKPWITKTGTGEFEDFCRLVCNEHFFFAMLFSDSLHPYSRDKRKVSYFTLTCTMFCLIVAFNYADSMSYTTSFQKYWTTPFLGSAFLVAPITLLLDSFMYQLVVLPCCIKNRVLRCIRFFITSITQLVFIIIGVGLLMLGLYIQGQYNGGSGDIYWLLHEIVFGLFVWPLIGRLIIQYLGYINIQVGCTTACGACYLCGNWQKEKQNFGPSNDCCVETCCACFM